MPKYNILIHLSFRYVNLLYFLKQKHVVAFLRQRIIELLWRMSETYDAKKRLHLFETEYVFLTSYSHSYLEKV